jgi:hypothetical protein
VPVIRVGDVKSKYSVLVLSNLSLPELTFSGVCSAMPIPRLAQTVVFPASTAHTMLRQSAVGQNQAAWH